MITLRVPFKSIDALNKALQEYAERHPNSHPALRLKVEMIPLEEDK